MTILKNTPQSSLYSLQLLKELDVNTPEFSVITSVDFTNYLKETGLDKKIDKILRDALHLSKSLKAQTPNDFNTISNKIVKTILDTKPTNPPLQKHLLYLYNPTAIFENIRNGNGISITPQSIIIIQNQNFEISGIAHTSNIRERKKSEIVIQAFWENRGQKVPDEEHDIYIYCKNKNSLIYIERRKQNGIPQYKCSIQKLAPYSIEKLVQILLKIEKAFYFPQCVAWGFSKNNFCILSVQPLTLPLHQNSLI